MPQVSIIVPVYKAEQYLRGCVDSILSQTFTDFEVFLVDDGSPDGCGAICDAYKETDPRIRVIHQENQGQAAARNHALAQARGSWICFVDSDDAIHPQMVELLHRAAEASGAGVSMCAMHEGERLPEDFLRDRDSAFEVLTMDEQTLLRLFDAGEYPSWVACAKLIRRELAENYPFSQGRVFEDNEAVCHWVCEAGKLARLSEDMYYYRTNPGSTTQRAFTPKKRDYLWALERIIRYYHSLGYGELTMRFCDLYVRESADQYSRFKRELNMPELAAEVRKAALDLIRRDGIPMTRRQKETLMESFHPKLIRYYWPAEAAVRTLRENGISGLVGKLRSRIKKGEGL